MKIVVLGDEFITHSNELNFLTQIALLMIISYFNCNTIE